MYKGVRSVTHAAGPNNALGKDDEGRSAFSQQAEKKAFSRLGGKRPKMTLRCICVDLPQRDHREARLIDSFR